MARYIAFDWGLKRTGIAVTDSNAIISSPFKTVNTDDLKVFIKELITAEPCKGLVVGVPGLMTGSITDSSEGIAAFIQYLETSYPSLTVNRVDEGMTSSEAMSAMISGGMKKGKRREKGALDRVAAAIILQRFLDEM